MDTLTCTLCTPSVSFRTHGEFATHVFSSHGKRLVRCMGGSGQYDPDPREEDDDDDDDQGDPPPYKGNEDDQDDTVRDAEETLRGDE